MTKSIIKKHQFIVKEEGRVNYCFGDHGEDGQCLYCKICSEFARPTGVDEHCTGPKGKPKPTDPVRKHSGCLRCAKGKFNKKMSNLKLWKFPEAYEFPPGFNFRTPLFRE